MTKSREITTPTIMQGIFTGSVGGAIEVFCNHPLWSIKTRAQRGDPFTVNPAVLYRGILPNAASMVPITAVQVGLNHAIQNLFLSIQEKLSNTASLACSFSAGIGSAFISCPVEMVMIHQANQGGSFVMTAKSLHQQAGYRGFMTGIGATAIREGMFSSCFLSVRSILKVKMQSDIADEKKAALAAGITAGVGAAVMSQGIDTIKTVQQAKRLITKDAITKIYSENGIQGFFKGGLARGTRVMLAVTILGEVTDKMAEKFSQWETVRQHK